LGHYSNLVGFNTGFNIGTPGGYRLIPAHPLTAHRSKGYLTSDYTPRYTLPPKGWFTHRSQHAAFFQISPQFGQLALNLGTVLAVDPALPALAIRVFRQPEASDPQSVR
jgi:hypothetical protein